MAPRTSTWACPKEELRRASTPSEIARRPFTREGRELQPAIFAELMNRCAAANGFSLPILAVHALPKGPMAATLYRDAGSEGEVIAEFPGQVNRSYPVRAIYIELSTLRSAQSILTEQAWKRMLRETDDAKNAFR